jgi:hypothetical protein
MQCNNSVLLRKNYFLKASVCLLILLYQFGCSATGSLILPERLGQSAPKETFEPSGDDCDKAKANVEYSKAWSYDGSPFNINRCNEIVIGKTTQNELLKILGQPFDTQAVDTNTILLFSYTRSRMPMRLMQNQGHCYATIPNMTPLEEQINSATAMVNAQGIVYRFAYKKGIPD